MAIPPATSACSTLDEVNSLDVYVGALQPLHDDCGATRLWTFSWFPCSTATLLFGATACPAASLDHGSCLDALLSDTNSASHVDYSTGGSDTLCGTTSSSSQFFCSTADFSTDCASCGSAGSSLIFTLGAFCG